MRERVLIERRFCGPPDVAHGGYACGLVAERLDAPAVAVSLRAPTPLERPIDLRMENGTAALVDGDRVLVEGRAAELDLDVPEPVALPEAERAGAASPWADIHPFPRCFGCGPARTQDEAVAIATGPVAGRDVSAGTWTPAAEFADGDGEVHGRFVWAALDCATAGRAAPLDGVSVLGRLTARLLAPVRAGVPHTVMAWAIEHDGRKHRGGAAIRGPGGEVCAYAEGLWIELRDPAAMGAR